jgi:hypothetical protein
MNRFQLNLLSLELHGPDLTLYQFSLAISSPIQSTSQGLCAVFISMDLSLYNNNASRQTVFSMLFRCYTQSVSSYSNTNHGVCMCQAWLYLLDNLFFDHFWPEVILTLVSRTLLSFLSLSIGSDLAFVTLYSCMIDFKGSCNLTPELYNSILVKLQGTGQSLSNHWPAAPLPELWSSARLCQKRS